MILSMQTVATWTEKVQTHRLTTEKTIVWGIVLAALLLRLIRLPAVDVPPDEAITLWFVTEMSAWELATVMPQTQPHFPTYYLILKGMFSVFGASEVVARIPSVIFGTATIVPMYGIGKRLYSRDVGYATAAVTTVAPFMIEISQWIRMYAVFAFFIAFSWWRLLCYLDERSTRNRMLYLLSVVLVCYTHYFGVLYVGIQWLWLAVRWYRTRERVWTLVTQAVLLSLPAVAWVLYRIAWSAQPEQENVIGLRMPHIGDVVRFLIQFTLGEKIAWDAILHYFWFVGPVIVLMLLAGLYYVLKTKRVETNTLAPILWFGAPMVLLYAYSKVKTPIFRPRYLIGSALALHLIVGRLVSHPPERIVRVVLAIAVVSSLGIGAAISYDTNTFGLNDAYSDIEADTDSSEQVVPIAFFHKVRSYHARGHDIEIVDHGKTVPQTSVDTSSETIYVVHQQNGPWGHHGFSPDQIGLSGYRVEEKTEHPKVRTYKLVRDK